MKIHLEITIWGILIICANYHLVLSSRTNFEFKKFWKCPSTNVIKFYGNITKEGTKQYLNSNFTIPYAVDEHIGLSVFIEQGLYGKNFIPLFTIREKDVCKAANKYLGEFWYDIERAAQIPVGVCPIPAGRYHIHHLILNLDKIALQTFPFGTLRFTFNVIDSRKKESILCLFEEVENVLN